MLLAECPADMKKRRLVLLGDSLGMHRMAEGIEYDDTYPALLSRNLYEWEVISRHKRANDSQLQASILIDDLISLKPDFVVIHLGIVDCAPRLFNRYEQIVLNRLPGMIRQPIISFFSRNRRFFTKYFKKIRVAPEHYRENMQKIIEVALSIHTKPVLINIADTSVENKMKSYEFDKQIIKYNQILSDLSIEYDLTLIDLFSRNDILMSDGIHLTVEGNILVARLIEEVVSA